MAVMGPSDVAQRRKLAQALIDQSSDASPVQHWTQALSRVTAGGLGGYEMSRANRGEQEGMASGNKALAQALAGGNFDEAMQNPYVSDRATDLRVAQYKQGIAQSNAERERQQQTSDPMYQAKLQLLRAQAAQAQSRASGLSNDRVQVLADMGIDPNSAEGKAFLLNGKLPAQAYEQMAQKQRRQDTAPNIAAGLENLNKMTEDYNDPAFDNAVGPWQGSTPDSLVGSIPINIARGLGELWNTIEGGNANPTEVRNNIVGNTESLAAAIKPLIRAPGEGVWTDADQARLVAIVGDLPQARSKEEFKRRLNAVRDRIKSNFSLDIPFDAAGNGGVLQRRGGQPFVSGEGQPQQTGAQPQRFRNPQTGQVIEWNGSQWVPVQ